MNDPHVVALIYAMKHRSDVDYENAEPLDFDHQKFSGHIESGSLRIQMKEHFANHEDAITLVEPFLKAWELDSDLNAGPGEIEFRYQSAEIIDRNPTPGQITLAGVASLCIATASVSAHVSRSAYPKPPTNLAVDTDVEDMQHRYRMLCDGRTHLGDAANYCLSVLKRSAGRFVSEHYGISGEVLRQFGKLAANKGGREEGRKATATESFSPSERAWLHAVIKLVIRRSSEVAHDRNIVSNTITMADLPPL